MLRTSVFLIALGSWLIGCGDDSGGTKSSPNDSGTGGKASASAGKGSQGTGGKSAQANAGSAATVDNVPRTKKLSDVSMSDLVALCDSHQEQFNDLVDPCTGAGFDAMTQADCEAAQAACKKDPSNQNSAIDCAQSDASDLTGCNVTVGEFEDCLGEVASYAKSLTCANFQNPPDQPACFTTIQKNCPSLFGP